MIKRKNIRQRGKLSLSKYFQKFAIGNRVAIVREHSQTASFPKRVHGLTGSVIGKRGRAYLIEVQDGNRKRVHIIKPVHLKKLK